MAVQVLAKHLRENDDFYKKWTEMLAESYIEEYTKYCKEHSLVPDLHKAKNISVHSAKNFLNVLITIK